jgi:hypothetical protein
MDALVQFFTTVAMVMASTALSHIDGDKDGAQQRDRGQSERSVKRTPAPQARIAIRLPR